MDGVRSCETSSFEFDDMLEILAYFEAKYGRRPVPNALNAGYPRRFRQVRRLPAGEVPRARGRPSSLVDVVNLVHPKATDRNREALEKLVKGELRSTHTWESKLTQAGQMVESDEDSAQRKAEAWGRDGPNPEDRLHGPGPEPAQHHPGRAGRGGGGERDAGTARARAEVAIATVPVRDGTGRANEDAEGGGAKG